MSEGAKGNEEESDEATILVSLLLDNAARESAAWCSAHNSPTYAWKAVDTDSANGRRPARRRVCLLSDPSHHMHTHRSEPPRTNKQGGMKRQRPIAAAASSSSAARKRGSGSSTSFLTVWTHGPAGQGRVHVALPVLMARRLCPFALPQGVTVLLVEDGLEGGITAKRAELFIGRIKALGCVSGSPGVCWMRVSRRTRVAD